MKPTLQAGHRHQTNLEVTRDRTIGFMGEQARGYATAMLLAAKAAKAGLA